MMLINPYMFTGTPSGSGYEVQVTIPSAQILANASGFPVYVDLSLMPAGFWTHTKARGADIRVYAADGITRLPCDVVQYTPKSNIGGLVFKADLVAGSNNVFRIRYGKVGDGVVLPTDSYGRNAVWSSFSRVHTMGFDPRDRCGNGAPLVVTNGGNLATLTETSPAFGGGHNGVVWDGAQNLYFIIGTDAVYKYSTSWSLISSHLDRTSSVPGTNHIGDSCMQGGALWMPLENYTGPDTHASMFVTRWDPSTVSLIEAVPVAYDAGVATGVDMAAMTYNPEDGLFYFGAWSGDGTKLWKWSPVSKTFVGTLSLSSPLMRVQGITYYQGAFFIIAGDGTAPLMRVELDGTVSGQIYTVPSAGEGITEDGKSLVVSAYTGGGFRCYRLEERCMGPTAGAITQNSGTVGIIRIPGVPLSTTHTMICTASVDAPSTTSRGIMSYAQLPAASANRATLAYHSTGKYGLWNSTDAWLDNSLSAAAGVKARLGAMHSGTATRKVYGNGAMTEDLGISARPTTGAEYTIYLSGSDGTSTEKLPGTFGCAMFATSALADSWMAMDAANQITPGTFMSVGSEQVVM